MGKTKMIKVYVPGWQLWIFSVTFNLVALALLPQFALAQTSPNPPQTQTASNTAIADLEPEILSEINRVRTSPQDYAQWLEHQRQYYDGIWLRLPGEKPVRTNRGKDALEEAITFLKQQKPLPALKNSSQTAANAQSVLENFASAKNIQFFSYGKKTASGIVMDLVVDELFPDRRRRQSLLSPEAQDTGVVCKPDPRYAKVCAIAYSDSPQIDSPTTTTVAEAPAKAPAEKPATPPNQTITQAPPEKPATPPNQTITQTPPEKPATPPNQTITQAPTEKPVTPDQTVTQAPTEKPATPSDPTVTQAPTEKPATPNQTVTQTPPEKPVTPDQTVTQAPPEKPATPPNQAIDESKIEAQAPDDHSVEEEAKKSESAETNNTAALPTPPTPPAPPTPPTSDLSNDSESNSEVNPEAKANAEEDLQLAQAESEIEQEQEKLAQNDSEAEIAESDQESDQSEVIVDEKAPEEEPEKVATNSDNSESADLAEIVEEGVLEKGDRVITDDGSLYDFYPIQGKAGESLTIHLESDDFDAFVALVDSSGKTVGENDDISKDDNNSEIQVTIPEDGVYNVIVNTYDENGTGKYLLKVSR